MKGHAGPPPARLVCSPFGRSGDPMPTIHTPAPGDPLAAPPPAASRRSVLAWLAATVPATTSFRYAIPWLRRLERLDDALLLAVATSILPSELGPDGARRIADALQKWIAGYRP